MQTEIFKRANFDYHGGYLHYTREDGSRVFVARFKYAALKKRKPAFVKAILGKSVDAFLELAKEISPLPAAEAFGMER